MTTIDATQEHVAPREAWDAIAAGYDEFVAPGEAALATEVLRMVGLRVDHRLLDVAAGTGGLSLPAARLGAGVVATDWSPAMISRFDARVLQERLAGAEGRVMDAHNLDLGDEEFDVAASQFGVMLVPDQARALREMVRVTKPGGRVLLVAYGPASEFEALQAFLAAVQTVAPEFEGLPTDPPPLEFQAADPSVMHERLATAGLVGIAVDTVHHETVSFATGQQFWDWMWFGNPVVGMVVGDLTDQQQVLVKGAVDQMVRERATGSGRAVFTARLTIGLGWK
ncbi:MAG TPA: class I SAM-dependent methyltransferase [Microlunatus sp.]|jgi:ubiquinone/menaquinone biosynthesis C-methylase UbiE|nr:class I SAM-dependent methyltransferase [Microlunatus sp.]